MSYPIIFVPHIPLFPSFAWPCGLGYLEIKKFASFKFAFSACLLNYLLGSRSFLILVKRAKSRASVPCCPRKPTAFAGVLYLSFSWSRPRDRQSAFHIFPASLVRCLCSWSVRRFRSSGRGHASHGYVTGQMMLEHGQAGLWGAVVAALGLLVLDRVGCDGFVLC